MGSLAEAFRLRWLRRRLLWRAMRAQLRPVMRRDFGRDAILGFACIRNEMGRLPWFLDHHRKLGVDHFLVVDNASSDGSAEFLAGQPDVSLWATSDSYKASRFGMDWINALLMRHGSGHWCLTLDADELFTFPEDHRGLRALTDWADARAVPAISALMLDLYPKGPLGTQTPDPNPLMVLPFFDPEGYARTPIARYAHVSIRGGPRARVFFADDPARAPHLHKTPLVRWHWRYAYLSSTHLALPIRLNAGFARADLPTGALLHTKFLPEIVQKSREERVRAEHFTHPEYYGDYYDGVIAGRDLWHPGSARYEGPTQLEALGLIQRGAWASR
ncbi:glycosyltransferase family 2 protein [Rhodobacter sp. KR11]|uniref:glycosyltransferase family 2 protein n=1 Tax=Rhodobacter sp. KR11 TaxID=2974588 RepID=UPI0022218E7E|nr:glycosyltransferase family 2 protein [Rhodobacter sp. KR11]